MSERERLTMADLATLAGVSKITVSRALRDSPAVREEVRDRIKDLARQHGYRLNVAARDLRRQRRQTIAVVVEMSPSDERPMSEPYPLALLGGIAQELAASDYSMLVTLRGRISDGEVHDSDAVILLGQGAHEDVAHRLETLGVPLVVWGAPTGAESYVVVGSDNLHGGQLAGEYMIERGRRRMVFLGDLDHSELADRIKGFRQAITAGGAVLLDPVLCDFTTASGMRAMSGLLQSGAKIDGVFACNDLVALGAIRALAQAGLRVPEDVSVVGYDDSPIAAAATPPVTTIRQNWNSGGRLLAAKVLELVRGGAPGSEALPTSLVVRDT